MLEKRGFVCYVVQMVRKGGIEPPRVLSHRILNPARLPIPPLSPAAGNVTFL
jgi:hypothetical protein